jgi:hypothetical protein
MSNTATNGEIYHKGRTYAEHCAWLDSLEGDEYRIVHMPRGHLFNLADVSRFKHALLTTQMTAGEQLRIFDGIASSIFGPVTSEAVAVIEPCCDTGWQILSEIYSLPIEKQMQAFSDGDVFRLLARLNLSLLAALRLCRLGPVPEQPRTRALTQPATIN